MAVPIGTPERNRLLRVGPLVTLQQPPDSLQAPETFNKVRFRLAIMLSERRIR